MTDPTFTVLEPQVPEVPVLLSIPHTGVEVPPDVWEGFADGEPKLLPDTDWHLHRLWDFAPALGIRVVHARFHRYVVDLNRSTDRAPLYPGRNETGLVPMSTFAETPIYRNGHEPDEFEVHTRVARYWEPYHVELESQLQRLRDKHGYAVLFDAHSIRSEVPRFFEGRLPDLMLGDVSGASAAPDLASAVREALRGGIFTEQSNDPFRGGFITRKFGKPDSGMHALQLEMCHRLYMNEDPPFDYRDDLAAKVRPVLEAALRACVAWSP